ncbi:MAG: hypothetical protein GTO14_14335 [Anaerolineales bacterium]|nr:hypothetical protein [Anaerolineales bacterium]
MTIFDLRPFGRDIDDLDIDFDTPLQPQLVTQVLQCCARDVHGNSPTHEQLSELEVGTRIEWLLRILARSGTGDLTIALTCVSPACQQSMEVELSVAELVALQQQAMQDTELEVELQGMCLALRRPRGSDMQRWQARAFDDDRQAQVALLCSLLVGEQVQFDEKSIEEGDLRLVDEAMQAFDPLVSFSLEVRCPYCEEQHGYPVDLLEVVLNQLRKAQAQQLEIVHRLAHHYHWGEAQILAMPEWRRERYLAMIDRERDR